MNVSMYGMYLPSSLPTFVTMDAKYCQSDSPLSRSSYSCVMFCVLYVSKCPFLAQGKSLSTARLIFASSGLPLELSAELVGRHVHQFSILYDDQIRIDSSPSQSE